MALGQVLYPRCQVCTCSGPNASSILTSIWSLRHFFSLNKHFMRHHWPGVGGLVLRQSARDTKDLHNNPHISEASTSAKDSASANTNAEYLRGGFRVAACSLEKFYNHKEKTILLLVWDFRDYSPLFQTALLRNNADCVAQCRGLGGDIEMLGFLPSAADYNF